MSASKKWHMKRWQFTLYGIILATANWLLAGLGVGRFFELWRESTWFFNLLIGTTSFAATAIEVKKIGAGQSQAERVEINEEQG